MAVIGAADGTGISTEKDDADQPRRTDKYRLMLRNFNRQTLVCTENELGTDRFKLGQLRSNTDSTTRRLKIGHCDSRARHERAD